MLRYMVCSCTCIYLWTGHPENWRIGPETYLNSVGSSSSVYNLSEKYTLLILQLACICMRSVSM